MIPRHLQYILRIILVQTVQNANKSVSPVIRSQGNVPNVGVLCTESTAISPVQYMICNHKTGACNGCKNGFKGKHCEQKTASFIVSPGIKLIKKKCFKFSCHWKLLVPYNEKFDCCWIKRACIFGNFSTEE